ncbi:hypothetical protein BASA83_012808 [Batrachochytrium salamandrivorans]|nr:hypothetical protein BASA83_012808 [Batrachochytrium salamandrivorans]
MSSTGLQTAAPLACTALAAGEQVKPVYTDDRQTGQSEPPTPGSCFSITRGISRLPLAGSLWHADCRRLVESLVQSLIECQEELHSSVRHTADPIVVDVVDPIVVDAEGRVHVDGGDSHADSHVDSHADPRLETSRTAAAKDIRADATRNATGNATASNSSSASPASVAAVPAVQRRLLHELLPIVVRECPASSINPLSDSVDATTRTTGSTGSTIPIGSTTTPNTAMTASRSVAAAQACLAALNYASCLEAAWDRDATKSILPLDPLLAQTRSADIIYGSKIRLLLVALFVLLSRRMDRDKLLAVFISPTLRNVPLKTSAIWTMSTMTDVLCQGLLSLINIPTPSPANLFLAGSKKHPQTAWSLPMADCARGLLHDYIIVLRNAVGIYDQNKDPQALVMTEVFVRRLLKQISSTNYSRANTEQLRIIVSVYSDCVKLLPCSFHTRMPPKRIKILLHPLLLLKHTVVHICRLASWHPGLREHSGAQLRALSHHIRKYIRERAEASAYPVSLMTDTDVLLETCELIDIMVGVVCARPMPNLHHSKGVHSVVAPHLTGLHSTATMSNLNMLILQPASARLLAEWAAECSSHRIVQIFLLPFVIQLVELEANWRMCEILLLRLLGQDEVFQPSDSLSSAKSLKASSAAINPWLPDIVLKWLVTLACQRTSTSHQSGSINTEFSQSLSKLSSSEAVASVRIFATRVLGLITPSDSTISDCLISLFDDKLYQIRMCVAEVMTIVGLNSISKDRSHTSCRHMMHGDCRLNCLVSMAGSGGSLGRPRISSPYSFFLTYLDNLVLSHLPSAVSDRERETIGLWAYYITRHIMFQCPIFDDRLSKSGGEASRKAISRVLIELLNRLVRYQRYDSRDLVDDSLAKRDGGVQHSDDYGESGVKTSNMEWAHRRVIAGIVAGILEGSWMLSDLALVRKRPTPPFCDPIVLQACIPILAVLRRDPSIIVRSYCVELCARLLGMKSSEADPARGSFHNIGLTWQDPDVAAIPSLTTLYRIVQGGYDALGVIETPISSGNTANGIPSNTFSRKDAIDRDPSFKRLCQSVVHFGRRHHPLAFNISESSKTKLPLLSTKDMFESPVRGTWVDTNPLSNGSVAAEQAGSARDLQPSLQERNDYANITRLKPAHTLSLETQGVSKPLPDISSNRSDHPPFLASVKDTATHPIDQTLSVHPKNSTAPSATAISPIPPYQSVENLPGEHMDDLDDDPADADIIQHIYADLQRQFNRAAIGGEGGVACSSPPKPSRSPDDDTANQRKWVPDVIDTVTTPSISNTSSHAHAKVGIPDVTDLLDMHMAKSIGSCINLDSPSNLFPTRVGSSDRLAGNESHAFSDYAAEFAAAISSIDASETRGSSNHAVLSKTSNGDHEGGSFPMHSSVHIDNPFTDTTPKVSEPRPALATLDHIVLETRSKLAAIDTDYGFENAVLAHVDMWPDIAAEIPTQAHKYVSRDIVSVDENRGSRAASPKQAICDEGRVGRSSGLPDVHCAVQDTSVGDGFLQEMGNRHVEYPSFPVTIDIDTSAGAGIHPRADNNVDNRIGIDTAGRSLGGMCGSRLPDVIQSTSTSNKPFGTADAVGYDKVTQIEMQDGGEFDSVMDKSMVFEELVSVDDTGSDAADGEGDHARAYSSNRVDLDTLLGPQPSSVGRTQLPNRTSLRSLRDNNNNNNKIRREEGRTAAVATEAWTQAPSPIITPRQAVGSNRTNRHLHSDENRALALSAERPFQSSPLQIPYRQVPMPTSSQMTTMPTLVPTATKATITSPHLNANPHPLHPQHQIPLASTTTEPPGTSFIVHSIDPASNPLVHSGLYSAMDLVLRHLVFSATRRQHIDYAELYSDGLVYGSLRSIATLPAQPVYPRSRVQRVPPPPSSLAVPEEEVEESDFVVREALHLTLKLVFRLDLSLFIDVCSGVNVPTDDQLRDRVKLLNWLHGIALVHQHLIPISRTLFKVEAQMRSSVSVAQALVIVRDRISMDRLTGGSSLRAVARGLLMLKSALEGDDRRSNDDVEMAIDESLNTQRAGTNIGRVTKKELVAAHGSSGKEVLPDRIVAPRHRHARSDVITAAHPKTPHDSFKPLASKLASGSVTARPSVSEYGPESFLQWIRESGS